MKILIIGGTRFVGRHLVEELIGRRHDLTMLNRGNNNIFPQLKTITGDRNEQSRMTRPTASLTGRIKFCMGKGFSFLTARAPLCSLSMPAT